MTRARVHDINDVKRASMTCTFPLSHTLWYSLSPGRNEICALATSGVYDCVCRLAPSVSTTFDPSAYPIDIVYAPSRDPLGHDAGLFRPLLGHITIKGRCPAKVSPSRYEGRTMTDFFQSSTQPEHPSWKIRLHMLS